MQHGGNPFCLRPIRSGSCLHQRGRFLQRSICILEKLLSELSCEDLWTLRNSIFDEHGYCFTQRPEADKFDNSDCTQDAFSRLALNGNERDNVSVINDMERAKFCH